MNDSSFFKSFVNVEKSNGATKDEEKAKNEEIHALRDINDQLKKKNIDLKKQVDELEQENQHLSNEHLAILKKQDNQLKREGDQSTLDDTGNGRRNSASMIQSPEEMA